MVRLNHGGQGLLDSHQRLLHQYCQVQIARGNSSRSQAIGSAGLGSSAVSCRSARKQRR